MSTTDPKIQRLYERREQARQGGGADRVEKQHKQGKLTARERIDLLLDSGSFRRDWMCSSRIAPPTSAWTTRNTSATASSPAGAPSMGGWSTSSRRISRCLAAASVEVHADKICKIMDMALKNGAPVIGLNDCGGARIQEGVVSLGGYADIFLRNTLASRRRSRRSASSWGRARAARSTRPALTDFIFMVKNSSYMFVTGPDVVKTVTHEDVTFEELGGASVAQQQQRRVPFRGGQRSRLPVPDPQAAELSAAEQHGRPAVRSRRRTIRCAWKKPQLDRPRQSQQALRHQRSRFN